LDHPITYLNKLITHNTDVYRTYWRVSLRNITATTRNTSCVTRYSLVTTRIPSRNQNLVSMRTSRTSTQLKLYSRRLDMFMPPCVKSITVVCWSSVRCPLTH